MTSACHFWRVTGPRNMATRVLFLIYVFAAAVTLGNATNQSRAALFKSLKSHLFDSDYDRALHPFGPGMDQFDPTTVSLKIDFLSIDAVSTSDQVFTSHIRMRMCWNDTYLVWTPSDYGNISHVQLEQQQLWLPDITIINSQDAIVNFGYDAMPVMLLSSGTVEWEPMRRITTACQLDVTYFPFDTQECKLCIRTYISLIDDVKFHITDEDIFISTIHCDNGQWELVSTRTVKVEGVRSTYDVFVKLRRRRTYHLLNIVLPVLFLSTTATLVFALPTEAGEKMGLSITVLLAFAVYLTIVFDELPETSLQTSILIVYLTILLGASALSVVLSVFVLHFYHKDTTTPVPPGTAKWVRALVRLMRTNDLDPEYDPGDPQVMTTLTLEEMLYLDGRAKGKEKPVLTDCVTTTTTTTSGTNGTTAATDPTATRSSVKNAWQNENPGIKSRGILSGIYNMFGKNKVHEETAPRCEKECHVNYDIGPTMAMNVPEVIRYDGKNRSNENDGQREVTWKIVSQVMDKFLLRFFAMVIVVTTAVCMSQLVLGAPSDGGGE